MFVSTIVRVFKKKYPMKTKQNEGEESETGKSKIDTRNWKLETNDK